MGVYGERMAVFGGVRSRLSEVIGSDMGTPNAVSASDGRLPGSAKLLVPFPLWESPRDSQIPPKPNVILKSDDE